MALSEDKIRKLRELAKRGVGGEKDNARAILSRNGVKWDDEPKADYCGPKGTGTGTGGTAGAKYNQQQGRGYRTGRSDNFNDFFDAFQQNRANLHDDPFFNHKLRIPGINSDFKLTVLSVIVSKLYGSNWKITFESTGEYAHIPGLGEVEHNVITQRFMNNYSRLVDAAKQAMDNTILY